MFRGIALPTAKRRGRRRLPADCLLLDSSDGSLLGSRRKGNGGLNASRIAATVNPTGAGVRVRELPSHCGPLGRRSLRCPCDALSCAPLHAGLGPGGSELRRRVRTRGRRPWRARSAFSVLTRLSAVGTRSHATVPGSPIKWRLRWPCASRSTPSLPRAKQGCRPSRPRYSRRGKVGVG